MVEKTQDLNSRVDELNKVIAIFKEQLEDLNLDLEKRVQVTNMLRFCREQLAELLDNNSQI